MADAVRAIRLASPDLDAVNAVMRRYLAALQRPFPKLNGRTSKRLAARIAGVSRDTICRWRHEFPEFARDEQLVIDALEVEREISQQEKDGETIND